MRYSPFRWTQVLLGAILFVAAGSHAAAQDTLGVKIHGLTVVEGNALMAAGPAEGLEVIYACIPAGIVVYRDDAPAGSRASLRTRVVAAITPHVQPQRIEETNLTQLAAEAACENVR